MARGQTPLHNQPCYVRVGVPSEWCTIPERLPPVRATIFDMDGVVTDTAGVHARAGQELFDSVLPELAHGAVRAFDPDAEYGRGRADGVRAGLADRGLTVSEGTPSDSSDQLTVHGLARQTEGTICRHAPPKWCAGLSLVTMHAGHTYRFDLRQRL